MGRIHIGPPIGIQQTNQSDWLLQKQKLLIG
jgi:hypothetical protein